MPLPDPHLIIQKLREELSRVKAELALSTGAVGLMCSDVLTILLGISRRTALK